MSARIEQIQQLASDYAHIYIAPHLDDAVLSCGGAIARHVATRQQVLVVTVCAGNPATGSTLNTFAEWLQERWSAAGEGGVALRRQEDAAAMEALGADYLWLDFLDAIYRLPDYNSRDAIFGSLAPHDPLPAALAPVLAELATRCPGAIFYLPLGVGNHVDHQAALVAAQSLLPTSSSIAYYEEFPYAAQPGAVQERLAILGSAFTPSVLGIDATLPRKISAVSAYAHQMDELFGDDGMAQMPVAVTSYAESLRPNEGTYGERVWLRVS